MIVAKRLDGGRACMAVWGRRVAAWVSLAVNLALVICIFKGLSGAITTWWVIVFSTQRVLDIPTVDEVTGPSNARVNLYVALLVLAVLALCPFPGGVGNGFM